MSTIGDDVYTSYRKYTLDLQKYRTKCYSGVANELQAEGTKDGAALAEQVRREQERVPHLMTREQFDEWWSGLDWEHQIELRQLYSTPVEEDMRATTARLHDRLRSRRQFGSER